MERALQCLEQAGLVQEAECAQQEILRDGVLINSWGMPAAAGAEQLCIRQAARAGIDFRHRRRAWLARKADIQLNSLPSATRAHHWAHGGEEGGLGFTANASFDLATWDDAEFHVNLRRRLRLRVTQQGGTCMHMRRAAYKQGPTTAPDGACAAVLDEHGDHAVQCMIGGDHTALHDAAADELATMQQQAGLRARREVYVPQLATAKKTEPRADIMCWGPASLPVLRLDFTVVSPWANRNAVAAQEAPAETARRAEEAKDREYGTKGGISVRGLALEAGGRHGPRLEAHLKLLASLARRRDGLVGREPRHHLRAWRTRLAVLLGRFTAHTVMTALGGHTTFWGGSCGEPSAVQLRAAPPPPRQAGTRPA